MMDTNQDEINSGGSAFWIVLTLIALSSLVLIMIWAYNAESIKGAILAVIFSTMILSSAVLSKLKVFDWASWGDNALSFVIGFSLWTVLGITTSFSVLSQNHLFATISSELPIILEFVTSVFLIPISEELFWMVGLPFALISIMMIIGKKYSVWKSGWVQIPVIVIVGALSFALFHTGKAFLSFIILAIIFRSILLFLVYSEHYFNWLKGINLVAGFAVGAHIANNLVAFGYQAAWLTIKSNFFPIGLLIVVFLGAIFYSGIERIFELLNGEGEKDKILSLKN